MLVEELLFALAWREKLANGDKDAALLVKANGRPDTWTVVVKALSSNAQTPIAIILSNLAKKVDQLGDYLLVSTKAPTEWCLGLAWRAHVKRIVTHSNGNVVGLQTNIKGSEVTKGGFPKATLNDWAYDKLTFTKEHIVPRHSKPFDKYTPTKLHDYSVFKGNAKNWIKGLDDALKTNDLVLEMARPLIESVGKAEVLPSSVDYKGVSFTAPPIPKEKIMPMRPNTLRDDIFMRTALAVVDKNWKATLRTIGFSGHNIGGILVGPNDHIVAWGINTSEKSPIFHAESLIVFGLLTKYGGPKNIPTGLRLYTSLEPCHMCSGMITTFCRGMEVIYAQKDPNIENNTLTRKENDCTQRQCVMMAGATQTVSKMIDTLVQKGENMFGSINTTGFLDHKTLSKPVFEGGTKKLGKITGQLEDSVELRSFIGESNPSLNVRALIDTYTKSSTEFRVVRNQWNRVTYSEDKMSRSNQALDLAMDSRFIRQNKKEVFVDRMELHLPLMKHVIDFLTMAKL